MTTDTINNPKQAILDKMKEFIRKGDLPGIMQCAKDLHAADPDADYAGHAKELCNLLCLSSGRRYAGRAYRTTRLLAYAEAIHDFCGSPNVENERRCEVEKERAQWAVVAHPA